MSTTGWLRNSREVSMRRHWLVLGLSVAVMSCAHGLEEPANLQTRASTSAECEHSSEDIRRVVFQNLIERYDSMPRQIDDPVGRRYCLAFDRTVEEQGKPAPAEFVQDFSSNRVHLLSWCDTNKGRIISVGPIDCPSMSLAKVWSFSWVPSRPGGTDCLHQVTWASGSWQVEEGCLDGLIYN